MLTVPSPCTGTDIDSGSSSAAASSSSFFSPKSSPSRAWCVNRRRSTLRTDVDATTKKASRSRDSNGAKIKLNSTRRP